MNDIFEKIGKTITETGKVVGEKTKQVGDIAKLNAKIIAAEHSISDNYFILGKFCYKKFKDSPDEEIAEVINGITASFESIAEMKAQLLSIKGVVKCQSCGSEAPVENDFCGKCGTKLVKPEPAVCECEGGACETEGDVICVASDEEIAEDTVQE